LPMWAESSIFSNSQIHKSRIIEILTDFLLDHLFVLIRINIQLIKALSNEIFHFLEILVLILLVALFLLKLIFIFELISIDFSMHIANDMFLDSHDVESNF
jgi:hypothetical protein